MVCIEILIKMMSNYIRLRKNKGTSKKLILQVIHQVNEDGMEVLSSKKIFISLVDMIHIVELLAMTTTSTP